MQQDSPASINWPIPKVYSETGRLRVLALSEQVGSVLERIDSTMDSSVAGVSPKLLSSLSREISLRLTMFYQRPVEDPYHGGSAHARGFLTGLRKHAIVELVAPAMSQGLRPSAESSSIPKSITHIIRAHIEQGKFVLRELFGSRGERSQAFVVFDAYSGWIPLVWSRITERLLVYYAQDDWTQVSQDFDKTRTQGRSLLHFFRTPLEQSLIRNSNLIAVVSSRFQKTLETSGLSREKIIVCELPRRKIEPDLPRINEWRSKLGLADSVAIVFVGNLGYPPNRKAAEFIRKVVAPALVQSSRSWRIIMVGPGSEAFSSKVPPIIGLGPVEDLDNLLYASQIGIAPMEVEGGISGKLVDYLTHGLVSVATPAAASGVFGGNDLVVVELKDFTTRLREFLDHLPIPPLGYTRETDPTVVEHYFLGTGTEDLVARLRDLRATSVTSKKN